MLGDLMSERLVSRESGGVAAVVAELVELVELVEPPVVLGQHVMG